MGNGESSSSVAESSQDVVAKQIVETSETLAHAQQTSVASMTPVRRKSDAPVGHVPNAGTGDSSACISAEEEAVVNSGPSTSRLMMHGSSGKAAVSTRSSQQLHSQNALKPAPDVGPGWKTFEVKRKGSIRTKGRVDRYWISPSGKKFRSGKEIERYQEKLKATNGDENAAWIAAKSPSVAKTLGKRRSNESDLAESPIPNKCQRRNTSKTNQAVRRRPNSNALKVVKKLDDDANINEQNQGRKGPSLEILPSTGTGNGTSPLVVNGGSVALIVMADPGKVEGRCFLDEFAPGRSIKFSFDVTHHSRATNYNPKTEFQLNGGTYTALATRLVEEGGARSSHVWSQKKSARVSYILTKGGGLPEFNLQKELEKVADFKSLKPHQIPARLEVNERALSFMSAFIYD